MASILYDMPRHRRAYRKLWLSLVLCSSSTCRLCSILLSDVHSDEAPNFSLLWPINDLQQSYSKPSDLESSQLSAIHLRLLRPFTLTSISCQSLRVTCMTPQVRDTMLVMAFDHCPMSHEDERPSAPTLSECRDVEIPPLPCLLKPISGIGGP